MAKSDYRDSHQENRISEKYENIVYRENSYDDMVWKFEKNILAAELEGKKIEKYLDFACGTGRIAAHVEGFALSSMGIDNSQAMLEYAKKKVKKTKLVLCDITKDDVLAEEMYDLITAFRFFLNAQPDLQKLVMRVLIKKLRDGNSIFIFNVHGNTLSHRIVTKLWYIVLGKKLNSLTYWQARRLAEDSGLVVKRWYGFGIVPKILYRILSSHLMYRIDSLLSKVPFLKYISYDLIFVCSKR